MTSLSRFQTAEQGYVIEDAGLVFTQPPDKATWTKTGAQLGHRSSGLNWALGDWLIEGGRDGRDWLGGSTYARAAAITGLSRAHLANAFRVARAFGRDARRPVAWSVHREVLRAPEHLRREVFARAIQQRWAADDVAAHIVELLTPPPAPATRRARAVVVPAPARDRYYNSPKVRCPKCSHTFPIKGHKLTDAPAPRAKE